MFTISWLSYFNWITIRFGYVRYCKNSEFKLIKLIKVLIWTHMYFYLKSKHIFKNSVHRKGLETMTNPVAKNTSSAKIIGSKYHFPLRKTSFLEKCQIPSLGQKMNKILPQKAPKVCTQPRVMSKGLRNWKSTAPHESMMWSFNKDNIKSTHRSLWKTVGNKLYFGTKQIQEKASDIHFPSRWLR